MEGDIPEQDLPEEEGDDAKRGIHTEVACYT
jgi:hypothetical protein